MVFAEIGGAASVDAVFEDADAIDVEAADDRPARGAGREGRAGNAGLGEQEIAKLGGALAADFFVRHHGDGCELIGDDRAARPVGARRRRARLAALPRVRGSGRAPCGRRAPASATAHGFRRTIGLGAVTVISGSCVEAGGDSRVLRHRLMAIAHSNSQLAPPKWNARFFLNVIVPILIPSMCDGSIPIFPRRIGRVARRTLRECINQSRSGDGRRAGLEREMHASRDARTRRRWSGAEVRSPAAAPAAAAWRTGNCWPARGRRRSRRRRSVVVIVVGRLLLRLRLAACAAGPGDGEIGIRQADAGLSARAAPWKCPNDSANWIASANSASREPVLGCFRNQFTTDVRLVLRGNLKRSRSVDVIL